MASRLASRKRQQAAAVHVLRESATRDFKKAVFLIPVRERAAEASRVAGTPRGRMIGSHRF
jgi:hypothetical protein